MQLSLPAKKAVILAIISVAIFICFHYTLGNQFTNWDDDYYVTNDPYIKSFTAHNLKVIFTEDITKNNYHPLCMLSLAVNYFFAGMSPWSYYLTNVLIHIINSILVFFLFVGFCRRLKMSDVGGLFVAAFGAAWFGLHPMHVESVAWIAERKDVLYTAFYVAGLLCYLRYAGDGGRKWYWYTFVLFILSCMSKPMAVVFPLSLLCVDVLLGRKFNKNLILEKAIFFLVSLLFGGMAFYTQHKNGAVAAFDVLTPAERIMYASYGFVMYVAKLFNPTNLSTFYPYPYRYITGGLPTVYYAAPFLALAIIFAPAVYLYKKMRAHFRVYVFGMGFFIANVIFVLQFISVGSAIMADRYSYVAYIGLFFVLAYAIQQLIEKKPGNRVPLTAALVIICLALGGLTYARTKVWHNSETLYTDAIEKYPYRALLSYKWRGNYYADIGEYEQALKDYQLLASINAADDKVKANMQRLEALMALGSSGNMMPAMGQAVTDTTGLQRDVESVYGFINAGDTLAAFKAYINAIRKGALAEKMVAQRCFNLVQAGQYEQSMKLYDILLKINTSNAYYYFYRGVSYFGTGKVPPAVADWEIAVKMNVKEVQQSASYNLSVAYDTLGNATKAYYYVQQAQQLGYSVTSEFMAKLKKRSEEKGGKK